MRAALVLTLNLLLGSAALAWVLWHFGGPAVGLLTRGPDPALLVAFAAAVAVGLFGFAFRWQMLLAGLGVVQGLAHLAAFRAAGQSLSAVLPSGKLGGEPLRVWLLVRSRVAAGAAIASVVVDRTLEIGGGFPFALLYGALLLRQGVPQLEQAFVTGLIGAAALAVGVALTARRLRRGKRLVATVARATGLDRLAVVRDQMGVLDAAEAEATRLVREPRRLAAAFLLGAAVNLVVWVEYMLLLGAFGLPSTPMAAVAAMFAAGAAHALPVPGAIGALEGAQIWIFSMLGYPPEVGLAVGMAVRLRELAWMLPGLVYLGARGLAAPLARPRTARRWSAT